MSDGSRGGAKPPPRPSPATPLPRSDDGTRPGVKKYSNTPKYRVGDSVYRLVDGEYRGPYTISSVSPTAKTYALCDAEQKAIPNGQAVSEGSLARP